MSVKNLTPVDQRGCRTCRFVEELGTSPPCNHCFSCGTDLPKYEPRPGLVLAIKPYRGEFA